MRCLDQPPGNPSSTRPALHRRTATLADLPPDLLAQIAGLLGPAGSTHDRISLAVCCRAFYAASLELADMWGLGIVHKVDPRERHIISLNAWLARRPSIKRLVVEAGCQCLPHLDPSYYTRLPSLPTRE